MAEWMTYSLMREHGVLRYLQKRLALITFGILSVAIVSAMTYAIAGEFPNKAAMMLALCIMVSSFVMIFSSGQGFWRMVEDFLFIAGYGAGPSVLLFDEIMPGSPILVLNMTILMPILAIVFTHLVVGSIIRFVSGARNAGK